MKKIEIIMPLISKGLSHNWLETSKRLSDTLCSVFQLNGSVVSVSVVGHDIPCGITFDDRCRWIPVSFDPPSAGSLAEKMNDKGLKTRKGVRHASKNSLADWVMFMDADDFISRDLLNEIDFDKHDAICLARGYSWRFADTRLEMISDFHRRCGTSWLMRLEPRLFPMWLGEGGDRVCDQAHNSRLSGLHRIAAKVQMVKKPSVVYLTGHGGNSVAIARAGPARLQMGCVAALKGVRSRFRSRLITPSLRDEFALPSL